MAAGARHHWIMVLDIENFSTRTDPIQRSLRGAMYGVLREAVGQAGLPEAEVVVEDRGDGVLMLIPATVSPVDLAGSLVRALDDGLAEAAAIFNEAHAMRFRVALHQGLVTRDGEGWSGDAVNTASRLVDAQPLREVLRAATGSRLVFVVSDEIHRSVIRHGYRTIDPAAYLPLRFRDKQGKLIECWVTVPGRPAPPGLPVPSDERPDGDGPAGGAARGADGGNGGGPAVPGGVTMWAEKVHGDQVGGDKNVTVHAPGQVRL
ncbi:hypothetical protein F0L17_09935 [Streptomyces sp. TRM43335]|uniref:Guanylate cyclase domain-containing protein n=2 Tax=Streptomyces taklimakanensis TaxID=2569853 RepID=A0A6G2BAZ1_9ACTN|nr:hypothetical protein [Streptomyces taklimakanensis]